MYTIFVDKIIIDLQENQVFTILLSLYIYLPRSQSIVQFLRQFHGFEGWLAYPSFMPGEVPEGAADHSKIELVKLGWQESVLT